MPHIKHSKLQNFIKTAFERSGFNAEDAAIASNVLISADLRGIDSHGCARLKGYLRQIKAGKINPSGSPEIIHETPSTATINAQKTLGLVTAQKGMRIAIEKAKIAGSGWVAINNSSHFGIAAAHAMLALEYDMIGFAVTNASPLVAPSGSKQAMLGTNPICFAIPAKNEKPVIIDLATTVVSNGKLEIADRKGVRIPEGWVQTKDGFSSTDPNELKKGGTLLPLGSGEKRSFHKGFALSSAVDILSGVLPGAAFGPWVPPFVAFLDDAEKEEFVGSGIGHFVGVWRIDAFRPPEDFKASMDVWIKKIRSAKTAPGFEEIIIPGEPEFRIEVERLKKGIPLNQKVFKDLMAIQNNLDLNILSD